MYNRNAPARYAKAGYSALKTGVQAANLLRGAYNLYTGGKKTTKATPVRVAAVRPVRRTKVSRAKPNLQRQVKELMKRQDAVLGTYTRKIKAYTTAKSAATNEVRYSSASFNSIGVLTGTIDAVKYFDPANPSTLITVDLSAPNYQQSIRFVKSYGKLVIRNNYSVPCRATMYFVKCKTDTSIAPETAISNSLTDESNASITSPMIFPTDCHEFNDLWQIVKSKSVFLQAGQEASLSQSYPAFNYDGALGDDQTESFVKNYHGGYAMVRVEGVLAHGSTSGNTHSQAGVDMSFEQIQTVKYPAGVNVRYLEIVDSPTTIVGTCQLSQLDNEQASYAL